MGNIVYGFTCMNNDNLAFSASYLEMALLEEKRSDFLSSCRIIIKKHVYFADTGYLKVGFVFLS